MNRQVIFRTDLLSVRHLKKACLKSHLSICTKMLVEPKLKNVPNLAPGLQGLFFKDKMKEEERLRSQSTKFIVGKGQLHGLL